MSWKYNVSAVNDWKYEVISQNDYKFDVTAVNDWSYEVDAASPVQIVSAETQDTFNITVTLDTVMNFTFDVLGETPTTDNFTITVNGSPVTISNFLVTNTYGNLKLQVILSAFILEGDTVLFTYNGDTWRTKDGQYVDDTFNYTITNNEINPPVYQSSSIPADGLTLTMTYNEALDETSVPAPGDFSLSGTSSVVSSVNVSGTDVVLTLDTAVYSGETVLLDYTAGVNPIRDLNENNAANLSSESVTNNSTVSAYCAEYQAVYDQFAIKPSDADAEAQNTFVQSGVTDGWWSDLDRLFIFASHVGSLGADVLIDWINPTGTGGTVVNAPSYTQYQGITGAATGTKYLNLNFLNNGLSNYVQDDFCAFSYIRSAGSSNHCDYGVNQVIGTFRGLTMDNNGACYANGNYFDTDMQNITGLRYLERKSSTEVDVYKNGVISAGSTYTNSSVGLNTIDTYGLARNNNGRPSSVSDGQFSLLGFGASLGATKQLSLYNAFQTLMTYYGTQV